MMQPKFPPLDLKVKEAIRTLVMFAGLTCTSITFALPVPGNVVNGTVDITTPDASSLNITQTTDKAIVNWNSFNIGAQEKVHFQQPDAGICLNRIDAANGMSQIAGQLTATGAIILVNGAGMMFSDSASINVGGLMASVVDIADDAFLNKQMNFDQGSASGSIINNGQIHVNDIALLFAASVANNGVIKAKSGNVSMASGEKISIDLYGDGFLNFVLEPITKKVLDQNGKEVTDAINVSGKIFSNEGAIVLAANSVNDIFDNLINVSGEVRAASSVDKDGKIALIAQGDNLSIKISGRLDASGAEPGTDGGDIIVLGNKIDILDTAVINASGDCYGGSVMIGHPIGIFDKGKVFFKTNDVNISPNSLINASSTNIGDAGFIGILSSDKLSFKGTAIARGGDVSGDGGTVFITSVSNKQEIDNKVAKIDVGAPKGKEGTVIVGTP